MSYDDRVKKVLELAGDYNGTITSFNLEKALYSSTCNKAREEIRQLVESLSLGDIKLSVNIGGYLIATKDDWGTEECLYKYSFFNSSFLNGDAENLFKSVLEESLLRATLRGTGSGACNIFDVARTSRYASLIAASVDGDVAEAIKKLASEYKQAEDRFAEKNMQYVQYTNAIFRELYPLACEWFDEKAVLTPGMKIGVINLKTRKLAARTIKRFKKTENSLFIALNESASIITDPARISKVITWYLNNGECSDIAKALKWNPIADFI